MKVKLDENLPASLAPLFSEFGHEPSTAIEEGLAGRPAPMRLTRFERRSDVS